MTETKAIDTHAHLWNEDYLDKLGKLGSQGRCWRRFTNYFCDTTISTMGY